MLMMRIERGEGGCGDLWARISKNVQIFSLKKLKLYLLFIQNLHKLIYLNVASQELAGYSLPTTSLQKHGHSVTGFGLLKE